MDMLKQLNQAIEYVESHLCEKVDLKQAARTSSAGAKGACSSRLRKLSPGKIHHAYHGKWQNHQNNCH